MYSSALLAALFASALAAPVANVEDASAGLSGVWPSNAFSPLACPTGNNFRDGDATVNTDASKSRVNCLYKSGSCSFDLTSGAQTGGQTCPYSGQSLSKQKYTSSCFTTCPPADALGTLKWQSIDTLPGNDKLYTLCGYEQSVCYYRSVDGGVAGISQGPPDPRCPKAAVQGSCVGL